MCFGTFSLWPFLFNIFVRSLGTGRNGVLSFRPLVASDITLVSKHSVYKDIFIHSFIHFSFFFFFFFFVQAFRQRQQVQAVALDIQAAYDTVWQVGLVEKMARLRIDRHLIEWTRGFLCDRVSVLEVGSAHLEVRPICGVPQGSPASPILFLIYINDLLQKLGGVQRVNRQAFADDLFL